MTGRRRGRAAERAREEEHRQAIAGEIRCSRDEIARSDVKAGTLQQYALWMLAGLYTLARVSHGLAAEIPLWAGGVLAAAALTVLLRVTRPRLKSCRGGIFADHRPLLDGSGPDIGQWNAARLRMFDRIAVGKHRQVQIAVDLLLAALVLFASGAVVSFA